MRVTRRDALVALLRLERRADVAQTRGLRKAALLLGRRISENVLGFMETPGTKRLARSFLVPDITEAGAVLGLGSPVYAAPHEYGATIRPVRGDWLTFQTPDGEWHRVKEVTITEKRYARDAVDETKDQVASILGAEIVGEFVAR